MKTHKVKIKDLEHYDLNEKIHTKENLALIKASIEEYGYVVPIIIDENNMILAGHGRVEVMQELGNDTIECVVLENLTEAQKHKFRLFDNQSSRTGEMDRDLMKKSIEEILKEDEDFNIGILGEEGLSEEFMADIIDFDLGQATLEKVHDANDPVNQPIVILKLTEKAEKVLKENGISYSRGLRRLK